MSNNPRHIGKRERLKHERVSDAAHEGRAELFFGFGHDGIRYCRMFFSPAKTHAWRGIEFPIGVCREDHNCVPEADFFTLRGAKRAFVKNLEKNFLHVRMRFVEFIKNNNGFYSGWRSL